MTTSADVLTDGVGKTASPAGIGDAEELGTPSVLGRTALIIEAFDDDHMELTLSELTLRTRLPRSTVHRLAEQLIAVGWLERKLGKYRLGLRLFEVGGLVARSHQLRSRALRHLHELGRSSGVAVHLGVLDVTEVVYLDAIPAAGLELPTRQGGRMPARCTGLGKAILAFAPAEEVDIAIEGASSSPAKRAALLRELDQVRRVQVAYDREESCDGIVCAAAPIRGSGRAIAAVSVTGPAAEFKFARMSGLVKHAAAAIWAEMFPARR